MTPHDGTESLVRGPRPGRKGPAGARRRAQRARARFVPEEMADKASLDYAIPIGRGQTTSQPSLVALMIEALALGPSDTVLEVGTGFGYQAALLGRLAGRVFSVERIPALAIVAEQNLKAAGALNVQVVTGDGTLGLPEWAPFDAVVVAAAFLSVPVPLVAQLGPGGRLVMPVGNGGGDLVTLFEKQADELVERRVLCGARLSPCSARTAFPSPDRYCLIVQWVARRASSATRAKTSRPWLVGLVERTTISTSLWPTSSSASLTTTMSPAGRNPIAWAGWRPARTRSTFRCSPGTWSGDRSLARRRRSSTRAPASSRLLVNSAEHVDDAGVEPVREQTHLVLDGGRAGRSPCTKVTLHPEALELVDGLEAAPGPP